ncbi:MAG TPA: Uma2 family endonuclease [Planctomycetaceae bacterium]|nr:Uma2 family endonuclease [Planctomycetaceae bacterium]
MSPSSMLDPQQPVSPSESIRQDDDRLIQMPAPPDVDAELVPDEMPQFTVRPITIEQYEYLVDIGFYGDARVEMLDGFVVSKMTHGDMAATIIDILTGVLRSALPDSISLRCQLPIRVDTGAPEPDLTVSEGPGSRYRTQKPTANDIFVVIEVSDSTLQKDRGTKLRMYARNQIREYWLVNCVDRQIEIYTEPGTVSGQPHYGAKTLVSLGQTAILRIKDQSPIEIPLATLFGEG